MFGMSDLIVSLWLLPVTLYVILPLGMLATWALARMIKKMIAITAVMQEELASELIRVYPLEAA